MVKIGLVTENPIPSSNLEHGNLNITEQTAGVREELCLPNPKGIPHLPLLTRR